VNDTVGRIKIAYQPHPDSAWKYITFRAQQFPSDATPTITPLGPNEWFVAASYKKLIAMDTNKILGFRVSTPVGSAMSIEDAHPWIIVVASDTTSNRVLFPSLASRQDFFFSGQKVRLLWQYRGQIYYRQVGFTSHSIILTPAEGVSQNLLDCGNADPEIATQDYSVLHLTSFGLFLVIGSLKLEENDVAVWDMSNSSVVPSNAPVVRMRDDGTGAWGPYVEFKSKDGLLHYPTVQTQLYFEVIQDFPSFDVTSEAMRIGWNNSSNSALEIAAEASKTWTKSTISESGNYPSMPLRTDSLIHCMSNYSYPVGLNPFVFQSLADGSGKYHVRTTNAALPAIRKQLVSGVSAFLYPATLGSGMAISCVPIIRTLIQTSTFLDSNATSVTQVNWPVKMRPDSLHNYSGPWFGSPVAAEIPSYPFYANRNDVLIIPRTLTIPDADTIFKTFVAPGDFVKYNFNLLRKSDSSLLASIDSVVFERVYVPIASYRDTVISPADSQWIHYTISPTFTADTVILAIQLSHSGDIPSLARTILYYVSDSTTNRGAAKTTKPGPHNQPNSLTLSVHPNPFNSTTFVELQTQGNSHAEVELFDILGNHLQTLYDGESPASGYVPIALNLRQLPSGSYLIRATNGNLVLTRRIEMLK
jgi:hypothetical protein